MKFFEKQKKFVVFKGLTCKEIKESKISQFSEYYDKWEDAHTALINKAENEIAKIRGELEHANYKLGTIKGMKK